MNKLNLGPASAVDEIISDAGTLQTLLDCIRKEISVSPIKRELMGTYADFYEGDVRRVEDLLSVSEKRFTARCSPPKRRRAQHE